MARKNETRAVNLVELSARVNVIVPVEYLHCVLENIAELRSYGDADVTAIREVEGDSERD